MSTLDILLQEDWIYTLYRKDDSLYLAVECGTIAVFTVTVELTADEKKRFEEQGEPYIQRMAYAIMYSPSSFTDRAIQLPSNT